MAYLAILFVLAAEAPAFAQLRASYGSNQVLNRLGRETRLNSPVTQRVNALQGATRFSQDYSGLGYNTGMNAQNGSGSAASRRRAGNGLTPGRSSMSGGSSYITGLGNAFDRSRSFVPLTQVPMVGSLAIPHHVERLLGQLTPGQLSSQYERRLLLDRQGLPTLDAFAYASDLLVQERSNLSPPIVLAAASRGLSSGDAMRTTDALFIDPLLIEPNQEDTRTAEAIWGDLIQNAHDTRIQAGWEALKEERFLAAAPLFRDAEIADPSKPMARAGQICTQLAGQQLSSAAMTLQRMLEIDGPAVFQQDLKLDELWKNQDTLRGLIVIVQNMTLQFPDEPAAKGLLAYLRWYSGDPTDALRLAREAKALPRAGKFSGLEAAMIAAKAPAPQPTGELEL